MPLSHCLLALAGLLIDLEDFVAKSADKHASVLPNSDCAWIGAQGLRHHLFAVVRLLHVVSLVHDSDFEVSAARIHLVSSDCNRVNKFAVVLEKAAD